MVPVLTLRFMGRPRLESDGRPLGSPRGRKAWAMLAYVALAERPPSRQELATLLFSDAEDPHGALRWNLSELRRALQAPTALHGDPVELGIEVVLDVRSLESTLLDAERILRLGGEFLEGINVVSSPAFTSWVEVTRQHLRASTLALVCESALHHLEIGSPVPAGSLAAHGLAIDPFDATCHALLVRSLAEAGNPAAARRQVEVSERLFRDELGVDLPHDIVRWATARPASLTATVVPPNNSGASARSYLAAGKASFSAGAVGPGTEQLLRAVDIAKNVADPALEATALVTLAGCQIHGAGLRGAEVAGPLLRGLAAARSVGDTETASEACRELAFLGVQLGHHDRADAWLDTAFALTPGVAERSKVLGVRGMNRSDTAHYAPALEALAASVADAEEAGLVRQAAWSRSMVGRIHLLCGEPLRAAAVLDAALADITRERWVAFLPWAQNFRAEAAVACGDLDTAVELLDHAWVLATESRDHCWLTTVACGQARTAAARGDVAAALDWVRAGLAPTPWYLWPVAHLLDAGCDIVARADAAALDAPPPSEHWSRSLYRLAARTGQREHLVRAQLHRARAGDRDQAEAARLGAAAIDNPALDSLVASVGAADPR